MLHPTATYPIHLAPFSVKSSPIRSHTWNTHQRRHLIHALSIHVLVVHAPLDVLIKVHVLAIHVSLDVLVMVHVLVIHVSLDALLVIVAVIHAPMDVLVLVHVIVIHALVHGVHLGLNAAILNKLVDFSFVAVA